MTPPPASGPEAVARVEIDAAFVAAGWLLQDRDAMNLSAGTGVAVREFKLKRGHGYADYLLFVNGKAVGVLEVKMAGNTLSGVEPQLGKYATGLPDGLNPPVMPLPFLYLSTGAITKFTNLLDPEPRSRRIFHIHGPQTLADWLDAPTLDAWIKDNGAYTAADATKPSTLRARLRAMPPIEPGQLYPNQCTAVANVERSLWLDKPRAMGGTNADALSSLASRLARLDKQCGPEEVLQVLKASGTTLKSISHAIIEALDPDRQIAAARRTFKLPPEQDPTDAQLKQTTEVLLKAAVAPLADHPPLRTLVQALTRQFEQIIDEVSQDELLTDKTGLSVEARDKARSMVVSFEAFLREHKDEISALQFFFSVPSRDRLHYRDIKELAKAVTTPPRSWTPDKLWHAYELLDKDKVRGASSTRPLTDIVSLVRYALHQDDVLVPHAERVRLRFENWMAEQGAWLYLMRDHVAASWEIEIDDFDHVPFVQEGGLGKAMQVFGKELTVLIREINEAVAA